MFARVTCTVEFVAPALSSSLLKVCCCVQPRARSVDVASSPRRLPTPQDGWFFDGMSWRRALRTPEEALPQFSTESDRFCLARPNLAVAWSVPVLQLRNLARQHRVGLTRRCASQRLRSCIGASVALSRLSTRTTKLPSDTRSAAAKRFSVFELAFIVSSSTDLWAPRCIPIIPGNCRACATEELARFVHVHLDVGIDDVPFFRIRTCSARLRRSKKKSPAN